MNIESRIISCELEIKKLRKTLRINNFIWFSAMALVCSSVAIATSKISVFDTIQAREINVVDGKGVIRARMAGDLPDGKAYGDRVMKRGTTAAGYIIYDKDGLERGGYVTLGDDNAMISLDSKHLMVASIIAGPDEDGAGAFNLINKVNQIELRADGDGARLSVAKDNRVLTQTPEVPISTEVCAIYKSVDSKWCRTRFSENACNTCFNQ